MTALWTARIFILYTLMVVVLPYIVMRKFLRGRSTAQKFVFCVVAGNFFYITIVLLWGLFHVTNRYVLIATTLAIPAVMAGRSWKKIWEDHLSRAWTHLCRFVRRENSFRYSMRIFLRWMGKIMKRVLKRAGRSILHNLPELILFAACSVFIIWYFTVTDHFGPRASDLAVHMYWINGVDDGILFREGIYPFGMHALLYYIHAVFNIPTARIVLLFAPVQTFYIFTMLLAFLKEICHFRYTPYLCYFAFAAGDYLVEGRYLRYYATLPQEFGMIFLLPCGIAMIRFFRAVRDERAEYKRMKEQKLLYTQIDGKRRWKESTIQLWLLIISFGLTLSAHFYVTIIAGILVAAAAIAYFRYIFNLKTLKRLVCAAVISILIPILPMAIAFAGGTPLQGSLYWALSVMGIGNEEDSDNSEENIQTDENVEEYNDTAAEMSPSDTEEGAVTGNTAVASPEVTEKSLPEKISSYCKTFLEKAENSLSSLVFSSEDYMKIWLVCMALLIAEIPLMWLLREWEYSRYLAFIVIFTGLMLILCISAGIGLPVLIDENRSTIFFCYIILAGISLAVDGILLFFEKIIKVKMLWRIVSLILAFSFVIYTAGEGHVRVKAVSSSSLQRDGAVLCVFDIMEKYPDEKWTIVSCNEERNMISAVAWHYEAIDFLSSMENYSEDDEMYIPTQYVFFFVEKRSVDYAYGEFEDADANVSEEWASEALPVKNGLTQYSGTNRIIVNSRMYYWAQEYQKRFPNEMKIYYEDDDFICYFIEQNEYYLNNFAINYGYNSGG